MGRRGVGRVVVEHLDRLERELGQILALACELGDLIVEGDPIQDISILQDTSRLLVIMQGGNAYKNTIGERFMRAA